MGPTKSTNRSSNNRVWYYSGKYRNRRGRDGWQRPRADHAMVTSAKPPTGQPPLPFIKPSSSFFSTHETFLAPPPYPRPCTRNSWFWCLLRFLARKSVSSSVTRHTKAVSSSRNRHAIRWARSNYECFLQSCHNNNRGQTELILTAKKHPVM